MPAALNPALRWRSARSPCEKRTTHCTKRFTQSEACKHYKVRTNSRAHIRTNIVQTLQQRSPASRNQNLGAFHP